MRFRVDDRVVLFAKGIRDAYHKGIIVDIGKLKFPSINNIYWYKVKFTDPKFEEATGIYLTESLRRDIQYYREERMKKLLEIKK